jgi:negative regulator of replication initiation
MKNKDKVLSLRVEEELAGYIEEQAKEWNMSVSDTLRYMIEAFYLPISSIRQAEELLKGMEKTVAQEEVWEAQQEQFKKVAGEFFKTIEPFKELVDRNIEVTNQLFDSYKKATDYVRERLEKHLNSLRVQREQGAEALKEEAMA